MALEGGYKTESCCVQFEHVDVSTVIGHKPIVVLGIIRTRVSQGHKHTESNYDNIIS